MERRLAAILAADVVGYSRLIRADEEGTLAALKALRKDLIDPKIAEHQGRIVKLMGDGMLAEFGSVIGAVNMAVQAQQAIAQRNSELPEDRRIAFRVGINLGDVVIDGDDIHGDGVNLAARLEALAEPGGICISAAVYDQVRDKLDLPFRDMGEQMVKNIDRPVRVWQWGAVATPGTAAPPAASTPLALPDKPSIAVLAFQNMSGDPEQEYFSDGIAEDIITDLSKISGLFVIARHSAFAYKDKSANLQEVSRELGVRYVLEGSVRKAANRVRVTAQLIDGSTGGHVWAERYDRDMTDIFAVQDELTNEIVSKLVPTLTEDERLRLGRKGTTNIDAYDCFIRARTQTWLLTKESNAQSHSLLRRAVEIEPGFAAAYSFIAFNHVMEYVNRWTDDFEQSLEAGLATARKAVELDDTEPMAHFALGLAWQWSRNQLRAIAEANRCLALDPNSPEGHLTLSHSLIFAGRFEEAIDTLDKYLRLDPHHFDIALNFLAEAHYQIGNYDLAITHLKRRLDRNATSAVSRMLLAACYGQLGRIEEARTEWARALRDNPNYSLEHRQRVLPYDDTSYLERFLDGLRKAGLPK